MCRGRGCAHTGRLESGTGEVGGARRNVYSLAHERHKCTPAHTYTQSCHTHRHAHTPETQVHTNIPFRARVGGWSMVCWRREGSSSPQRPQRPDQPRLPHPLGVSGSTQGTGGAQPFPTYQSRDEAAPPPQPSSQRIGRTHKGRGLPRVSHPNFPKL